MDGISDLVLIGIQGLLRKDKGGLGEVEHGSFSFTSIINQLITVNEKERPIPRGRLSSTTAMKTPIND